MAEECTKSDPAYIDRIVNNLIESSRAIATKPSKFPEISMDHAEYIHSVYAKTRIEIEGSFSLYADAVYPEGTNQYFIWKDSNFRVAWEYLRKSGSYIDQWKRIGECLSDWESFLLSEPINRVPDQIIDVFRSGSTLERYRALKHLRKLEWNKKLARLREDDDIHYKEEDLRDCEQKTRKEFMIIDDDIPHFSERRHPIFCKHARRPELLWRKNFLLPPTDNHMDDLDIQSLEDGVAVFLRKDENLPAQIRELVRILPGYFSDLKDGIDDKYRFRDDLHSTYLSILSKIPKNSCLSGELAQAVYPNIDPTSAFKRLEKAVAAAAAIMDVYYINLACRPFRPSTIRRYRQ